MLKKIKSLIYENRQLHKENLLQLKELEWAHVYHDSIRGKEWLGKLPLNIGRWAGNYSFFYVLNRILSDYKPNSILEFGLGESSKFVSAYLENELLKSKHQIIEQDENWHQSFNDRFQLSERSRVAINVLVKKNIDNHDVNSYSGLKEFINQKKFDLYIIDGPFGSKHYSRYDIVELAKGFAKNDEFIIIIDDYQRIGEKETVHELLKLFKEKDITTYWGEYSGNKTVGVLGTKKYKNVKSF